MRVLLVIPPHLYRFRYPAPVGLTDLPIGMAYIAAALKRDGHEVRAANTNNTFSFGSAREALEAIVTASVLDFQPELVMTGGLCTDYAALKDTISIVRHYAPGVPIALGGGIVTHDPDFAAKNLRPDYVLPGEAEVSVCRLARGLPFHDCPLPPIDSLPIPDLSVFGDFNRYPLANRYLYRYPQANPRPMVIVAGRSCPFRCTFCVHASRPAPYRARSIASVMEELRLRYEQYWFNTLVILDELFSPNSRRLLEFSQAVLDSGMKFSWTFQTHCSADFGRQALRTAKAAGLYSFSYGMESASPTVLRSMNKRSDPERILRGIERAAEVGIGFGGNFIFGDPAETRETVDETFAFFRQHCRGLHLSLGAVQPYPGSKLFSGCLKDGTIQDKAAYYAHIDEQRFNLTRLPSKPWLRWLAAVSFLGGNGYWLPVVTAHAFGEQWDGLLRTRYYQAICPWCGESVWAQSADCPVQQQAPVAMSRTWFSQTLLRVKDTRLFVLILLAAARVLSLLWPWWRHVPAIVKSTTPGAMTGCPKCNKAFRVR